MKIISKFADYYDYATTGFDTSDVPRFNRVTQEVDLSMVSKKIRNEIQHMSTLRYIGMNTVTAALDGAKVDMTANKVIFCGKTYRSISVKTTSTVGAGMFAKTVEAVHTFYEYNAFVEHLAETVFDKMEYFMEYLRATNMPKAEHLGTAIWSPQYYLGCQATNELEQYCIDHSHVALVYSKNWRFRDAISTNNGMRLVSNPPLRDFDFEKVLAPTQARQEVDMFLSNISASGENTLVTISDKSKISKYGFDDYSFKKAPDA